MRQIICCSIALIVSLSLFSANEAVAVPPNEAAVDHSHPGHYAQPTIRRFERRFDDEAREQNWDIYVQELDELWREYRAAGSNPRAWKTYKWEAAQAKRRYVYEDAYLKPVHRNYRYEQPERYQNGLSDQIDAEPNADTSSDDDFLDE